MLAVDGASSTLARGSGLTDAQFSRLNAAFATQKTCTCASCGTVILGLTYHAKSKSWSELPASFRTFLMPREMVCEISSSPFRSRLDEYHIT
eukprot:2966203-Rhodomonas_salina.1